MVQLINDKEFFKYLKRRFYNPEVAILNKKQRKFIIRKRPKRRVTSNITS
jgi:hypothetical protein